MNWPDIVFISAFSTLYFPAHNFFIFARDVDNLKTLSNIINANEYIDDCIDKSEYAHRTCTLAQSPRLAWILEATEANL